MMAHYPIPTSQTYRIVQGSSRSWGPWTSSLPWSSTAFAILASKIKDTNVKARYRVKLSFRISCTRIGRRWFEASRSAYQRPPFWIISLQWAAGHQKSWTSRVCAILSSFPSFLSFCLFLAFFSLSLSYPSTCPFSLLLSLALSHTVDLLGGGSHRCTRQVFDQYFAPDFNWIPKDPQLVSRVTLFSFVAQNFYFIFYFKLF